MSPSRRAVTVSASATGRRERQCTWQGESAGPATRDPVCGRVITGEQALLVADHHGTTYLFCSEHCRMLCALHPEAFTADEARTAARE